MARQLSAAVTKIKNSQRFTYYDICEIELPLGPGDGAPRLLTLSPGEIEVTVSFDFESFTYAAFAGVLARAPRAAEQTDWIDSLTTAFETSPAALLTEATSLIEGLFTSSEYTDRLRTDEQFIDDLYRAYFGRIADLTGKAFWLDNLAGSTRADVRAAFAESPEFGNRVANLNQPVVTTNDGREWGDVTFSEGAAVDTVEFLLTNAENTYSDLAGQPGRRLYPAPAIVKRAFKLPDGSFESVVLMIGFAKFGQLNGDTAKITIVPDTAPDGTDIVEEVTQRCVHIYKGSDCDSPDASATCSRLLDDTINGCSTKAPAPVLIDVAPTDNRASFKGIPQLAPSSTPDVVIGPHDPPWGGGDYDPNDPINRRRNQVWDNSFN